MTQTASSTSQRAERALRLIVPRTQAISVEHPCIVQNAEKAIDMIGGSPAILQALEPDSVKTFALSFHPQDPAAHTILANRRQADNVLLGVTVPKRTGRKRRRGTNDPWIEDESLSAARRDTSHLIRSIIDNPRTHNVHALSSISSTHVWRSMPDFAFSTANTQILQDVKTKILSQHYPSIKEFDISKTHGLEDTATLPPRVWSNQSIPINYAYRQNPSVKLQKDPVTGELIYRNTQEAPKIYSYQVQWDTPEYPTTSMPGLPPLEDTSDVFKATTAALKQLFDERPIWTRRALLNSLPLDLSSFNVVRFCLPYVAFAARSGPWRDTYLRLGVDPRKDRKYRVYQSVMLQLVPKQNTAGEILQRNYQSGLKHGTNTASATSDPVAEPAPLEIMQKTVESRHTYSRFWSRSNDRKSHIFDGVSAVPPDGKVWQLCDIVDSQIAALRDLPADRLRPECDDRYFGWYWNGTSAKIRVALRAKVDALINNKIIDHSELEPFMKLSDQIDPNEVDPSRTNPDSDIDANNEEAMAAEGGPATTRSDSAYLSAGATKQQISWASTYRNLARTGPGVKADESKDIRATRSKGPLAPNKPRPHKGEQSIGHVQKKTVTRPSGRDQSTAVETTTNDIIIPDHDGDEIDAIVDDTVMPSIELDGFEEDNDNGSDFNADVKIEEDFDDGYDQTP